MFPVIGIHTELPRGTFFWYEPKQGSWVNKQDFSDCHVFPAVSNDMNNLYRLQGVCNVYMYVCMYVCMYVHI